MFVALVVHTVSYAGFFEDPITWVLLAVGSALAVHHSRERQAPAPPAGAQRSAPAA
jgi:hypothetical protein